MAKGLRNMRMSRRTLGVVLMLALFGVDSIRAQDDGHVQMNAGPSSAGQEQASSIGRAALEISCRQEAKAPFAEGVAHLHSFAFPLARRAFQKASQLDPSCAMAYWGEALSYYDPLFQPPTDEDVTVALRAIEQARASATQTDRERGYVDSVRALFLDFPKPSRLERDVAYSEALAVLAQKYPADHEAAIFYALSLLARARRGVADPGSLQLKAAQILEPLLQALPEHPGVAHYLIHAYDDSGLRERGIAAAERYAQIAPSVTHALHMPSHIFAGMGMWDGMIASNRAALKTLPSYYHALTWLVYAHLQKGQFQQARTLVEAHRRDALARTDNRAERSALLDMDTWLLLETRSWKDAAGEPEYWDGPLERVAALYMRGLGAARLGNREVAGTSLNALQDIIAALGAYDDAAIVLRARMATVQAKQIEAALELSEGRAEQAIARLREACEIEDAPGVSWLRPDSGTPIPSRELLGELLLDLNRPQEAVQEFERALRAVPGRLRSVHGLARATARAANRLNADVRYRELAKLLSDADEDLSELAEARQYMAGQK
jgi:tetratricopeptide (TPR) repeat protein